MNLRNISVETGDWFFKYRNYVFPAVLVVLFAGLQPAPFMGSPVIDAWLDMLGLLIALAGSALRGWVIGLAYIKRGGLDKKVHADTLVNSGMFAVCRNPLYVGNALVLLGLFVVHNNTLAYAIGIPFFVLAYWCIVAAEEKFLAAKFGEEYRAYCARVNRFWPDFSRYGDAVQGMDFNWRRIVIKDYSTIYTWVVGMMVLIAYEHASWGGASFLDALSSVAIPVAIATVIVVLVRVLKKRGILSENTG